MLQTGTGDSRSRRAVRAVASAAGGAAAGSGAGAESGREPVRACTSLSPISPIHTCRFPPGRCGRCPSSRGSAPWPIWAGCASARGPCRPSRCSPTSRPTGPDHVAVTGDLTNLALPGEFAAARDWLARLGPPARVTAIPGNHDATVRVPWQDGIGRWRPWMADDGTPAGGGRRPWRFPFLRRRGPVALIGLCSAVPTLPGSAAGWLGADQLARLPALLEAAGREGLFRIVMVHHPPLPGRGGWRRELRDREALRAVLRRDGAELVLHGHHHAVLRAEVEGPAGPIPVLGAPLALRSRRDGPAGWHLHRIARDGARAGGSIQPSAPGTRLPARSAPRRRGRCRISSGGGPPAGLAAADQAHRLKSGWPVVPSRHVGEGEKPRRPAEGVAVESGSARRGARSASGARRARLPPPMSCDIHTRERCFRMVSASRRRRVRSMPNSLPGAWRASDRSSAALPPSLMRVPHSSQLAPHKLCRIA